MFLSGFALQDKANRTVHQGANTMGNFREELRTTANMFALCSPSVSPIFPVGLIENPQRPKNIIINGPGQ